MYNTVVQKQSTTVSFIGKYNKIKWNPLETPDPQQLFQYRMFIT